MARMRYIDPSGRMRMGELVVLQQVGEMADGKLHFVAGTDEAEFHLEDNDKFFTAIFAINPFEKQDGE